MAKKLYIQGLDIDIPIGQSTATADFTLSELYEFYGVQIFLENPTLNDELDFKILAPIPPDYTTYVEVNDYSNNTKLTSKVHYIEIKAEEKDDPAELPAGLKMRVIYTAVDNLGRNAKIWFRLKK